MLLQYFDLQPQPNHHLKAEINQNAIRHLLICPLTSEKCHTGQEFHEGHGPYICPKATVALKPHLQQLRHQSITDLPRDFIKRTPPPVCLHLWGCGVRLKRGRNLLGLGDKTTKVESFDHPSGQVDAHITIRLVAARQHITCCLLASGGIWLVKKKKGIGLR